MLTSLSRAMEVTLYSLKQLMTPFHEDSDNFYGDVGHVKIAVRKDCSGIECERLRQLAQQVQKIIVSIHTRFFTDSLKIHKIYGVDKCCNLDTLQ